MATENLNEQIEALENKLTSYKKELDEYQKWAISNDGKIDETEKKEIERMLLAINGASTQIEELKEKRKDENTSEEAYQSVFKNLAKSVSGIMDREFYVKIQDVFKQNKKKKD